jgi:anti-sigma B factor antagonist
MNLIESRVVQQVVVARILVSRMAPATSRRIVAELDELIHPGTNVLLDLEVLELLDAPALSLLLRCVRRADNIGATVRICNLQSGPQLVAEMSKLNQIIDIYNSESEAIRAISGKTEKRPANVESISRDGLLRRRAVSAS